jgi:predicted DNA-binding transcriptional regulator YafY
VSGGTPTSRKPELASESSHAPPKTVAILTLARELAASAEGLTLDEMAWVVHASRRSAERMRDAVEAAFGTLDRIEDGRKIRFRHGKVPPQRLSRHTIRQWLNRMGPSAIRMRAN